MLHNKFDAMYLIKQKRKKRRAILMANATSPNKLANNANYHDKCERKTIIFRPQDKSLYKRFSEEVENGNGSELVRTLLQKYFDDKDLK